MHMVWFFLRANEQLYYEIRRQPDGDGYELTVKYPDGSERIERFNDSSALNNRSLALNRFLEEQGWRAFDPRLRSL